VKNLYVCSFWEKTPSTNAIAIDTTSRSKSVFSPFLSGCRAPLKANCMENAWQYSKVYPQHNDGGKPNKEWSLWHYEGLNKTWADRYPAGKGAVPLYTWYNNQQLSYVEARKALYVPLYRDMIANNKAAQYAIGKIIKQLETKDVYLKDFDGYNDPDKTFDEIINDSKKKMGHAFILREIILEKIETNG
jgi:hypothetical protein